MGGYGLKHPEYMARLTDSETVKMAHERCERIIANRDLMVPNDLQTKINTIFYNLGIWDNLYYLGIKILKNPCDLL